MNDLTKMFLSGLIGISCLGKKDAIVVNNTYNITYNMIDKDSLKNILEAFTNENKEVKIKKFTLDKK